MALTEEQRRLNADYRAGKISDREYASRYMSKSDPKQVSKLSNTRNTKTNTTTTRSTRDDDDDDKRDTRKSTSTLRPVFNDLNERLRSGEISQQQYAKDYMRESLGREPSEDVLSDYSDVAGRPSSNEEVGERMRGRYQQTNTQQDPALVAELARLQEMLDAMRQGELAQTGLGEVTVPTGETPQFDYQLPETPTAQDFGIDDLEERIREITELQRQQLVEQAMAARDRQLSSLEQERSTVDPMFDTQERGVRSQARRSARSFQEYLATRGLADSGSAAQAEISQGAVTQGQLGDLAQQEASTLADIASRVQGAESEFATNERLAGQRAAETQAVQSLEEARRQQQMQFQAAQQQAAQQFQLQQMAIQDQFQRARDTRQMQFQNAQAQLDRQYQQQESALDRQLAIARQLGDQEFEREVLQRKAEIDQDYLQTKTQLETEQQQTLRQLQFNYDAALDNIRTRNDAYLRNIQSDEPTASQSDARERFNMIQAAISANNYEDARGAMDAYGEDIREFLGEDAYRRLLSRVTALQGTDPRNPANRAPQ